MLQRPVRAGTPIEVTVLAVMVLVLSLGCLTTVAFPLAPETPRATLLALGAFTAAIALGLALGGPRVNATWLHGTLVVLVLLRGVMVAVAVTERGLMLGAVGFIWAAVYVAVFLRPEVARAYAALITVTFGAALLLARAPTDVSVWIVISLTVWLAIVIVAPLNARLRDQARADALTGLHNRTGFALEAGRQRAIALRRGEPVALAVIDLDDFKDVNDREGHAAGDRLLADLAACWSAALRPADVLARFGGDEFVLLVPGTGDEEVGAVLARLESAHPAAWTAGAVLCGSAEPLEDAIRRADERLYVAKQARAAFGRVAVVGVGVGAGAGAGAGVGAGAAVAVAGRP
jgi:diguanylate cyclase (GGDEF)-like protein